MMSSSGDVFYLIILHCSSGTENSYSKRKRLCNLSHGVSDTETSTAI